MSQGHHETAVGPFWPIPAILHGAMFAKTGAIMRYWLPAVLVLVAGATAHAAPDEQDAPASIQRPRGDPDFLFGRPGGTFGIRGSWIFNREGSDWYDFVTDQLTIDRGALNAPAVTLEVGFSLSPRFDVLAGVDFSGSSTSSEYRRFVDHNRLPINQRPELKGTTISGSVRYALIPRGREVGSVAWVPSSIVPYVGAGGGAHWFKLNQQGDFVDFVDLSVFSDVFVSSGWSPSAHVFGGADVKLHKRMYLTVYARCAWTKGSLSCACIEVDALER